MHWYQLGCALSSSPFCYVTSCKIVTPQTSVSTRAMWAKIKAQQPCHWTMVLIIGDHVHALPGSWHSDFFMEECCHYPCPESEGVKVRESEFCFGFLTST